MTKLLRDSGSDITEGALAKRIGRASFSLALYLEILQVLNLNMKFERTQPGQDSTSFMEMDLEITGEDGGTVKAKYDGVDEELIKE